MTDDEPDPPAELLAAMDAWLDQASGDQATNERIADAITAYGQWVAAQITARLNEDRDR